MPLFLKKRDTTSRERMDDLNCDQKELQNTYRQFSSINSLISGWNRIYELEIRPHLYSDKTTTLLDVGFGGGDIPISIANWALKDGLDLQVTAIDPDPRAFDFVQHLKHPPNAEFRQCEVSDLDLQKQQFDFVISNHLLHHLDQKELHQILTQAKKLSRKFIFFNDLCRSDWAYILFNIFSRPVFRSSFITEDGLTSIKRSYTYSELSDIAPEGWHVQPLFPFRLLLSYTHKSS